MFIPNPLKMKDKKAMHDFIQQFSFGVLLSNNCDAHITGTHLPFILNESEGKKGILYCHLARANRHWRALDRIQVMAIFSGPHSYISPTWYQSKPAVPTWNYAAVHASGVATVLNADQTLTVVENTLQKYEPELLIEQDIVTPDYRDKLLSAIVGVKIKITHLEGQLKLGQQRNNGDQQGVYNALCSSDDLQAKALAEYMQTLGLGVGC